MFVDTTIFAGVVVVVVVIVAVVVSNVVRVVFGFHEFRANLLQLGFSLLRDD
jgi:uncharacterized membrane protein